MIDTIYLGKEKITKSALHLYVAETSWVNTPYSFFGANETFEIKHTSYSRTVFAEGAIKACKFMKDKPAGLYNMNDLV